MHALEDDADELDDGDEQAAKDDGAEVLGQGTAQRDAHHGAAAAAAAPLLRGGAILGKRRAADAGHRVGDTTVEIVAAEQL